MDLSKFTITEKIILLGGIIAIISLFLPWVDAGIVRANGFQQEGYIILLAFIYPIIMIIRKKNYHRRNSIIFLGSGIGFMLYFISTKSTEFLGVSVDCASTGMYIMVIGLIVSLIGVIRDKNQTMSI